MRFDVQSHNPPIINMKQLIKTAHSGIQGWGKGLNHKKAELNAFCPLSIALYLHKTLYFKKV